MESLSPANTTEVEMRDARPARICLGDEKEVSTLIERVAKAAYDAGYLGAKRGLDGPWSAAKASPRASAAVVLVVGARLCGQASFSTVALSTWSAFFAR